MHRFKPEPLEPLLKALEHPVRAQVLAALGDRSASAAEIAEIVEIPARKVRYHLRALAESGLIDWKESEQHRGVREYYWVVNTPQIVEDEQHAELSPEQVRQISLYALRLIFSDATEALRDDNFAKRTDHCLTRFRPQVDEQGWRELVQVYRAAITGIVRTSERAAERLEQSGEDPTFVNASLLLFDLETPDRPPPKPFPAG